MYSKVDGDQKEVSIKIEPEKRSFTIKDLEKWSVYQVSILAGTAIGDGPHSNPIQLQTDEDGMLERSCFMFSSSSFLENSVLVLYSFAYVHVLCSHNSLVSWQLVPKTNLLTNISNFQND